MALLALRGEKVGNTGTGALGLLRIIGHVDRAEKRVRALAPLSVQWRGRKRTYPPQRE